METAELDTAQEAVSSNGHDDTWQSFDDDDALLRHILSKKPAEKIVPIPEWGTEVLCRALNIEGRLEVNAKAYDKDTKTTDFRRAFYLVVLHGTYNPVTNRLFFKKEHENALMREGDGGPIQTLAMTILRLSRMISTDAEDAKKN